MATLQSFDTEIEKTRGVVADMKTKLEKSATVLDQFAKADTKIGDVNFDIENARISDVINQQKVMEGNIADLIIGLEDATNVFGSEFESMKGYSGWVIVEAEQDPKKANPLAYAKKGVANLRRFLSDAGLA